ncbi:MAG: response regulator [Pirellulaceae bacterium]
MNACTRPVVLVIDPDALTLTAISAVLNSAEFRVFCAQDRAAALKGARDLPLDLILCDEAIDDSQGESLLAEIRALPDRDDVPIMYMSERQLPDVISRKHGEGAAYHIRKPLEPGSLMEQINRALFELPLINNQIRNKLKRPHFPVLPQQPNFTIPHISVGF